MDNYGGLRILGRSGNAASLALQSDNVGNGAFGQWILTTHGNGANSPNDLALNDGGLGKSVLTIQASSGNIGVGNVNPQAKVDIVGTLKITDGTQSNGFVLTSDANGLAAWKAQPALNFWSLNGNAGTLQAKSFIGTTDNSPLVFKVDNVQAGKLDATLNNTLLGNYSGLSNTTGYSNAGFGSSALTANTTGYENSAFGAQAGSSLATGNSNNCKITG